ncbi:MAG: DUF3419 family protein [Phycisphaeraceae bacterium]
MPSEVARHADFSEIRYAQCWEDADVLLDALRPNAGDVCLSIASAGDNALSLLSRGPAKVVAVDLSPAQLACLALRVAAYRCLEHHELLELVGSRESDRRESCYQKCRAELAPAAREYWDARPTLIRHGIGGAGRFERYFTLFRQRVLPLVHSRRRVRQLLAGGGPAHRQAFYDRTWNNRRWRLMFRLFFSRFVMGRLGRDPAFFRYVDGPVGERILERARHALTELDPAENPYLQWILTGRHTSALPHALREENFEPIRRHLNRLEWHCCSLEDYLQDQPPGSISAFNLSDVFEYISPEASRDLLEKMLACARPGARLAYWNMLVPRERPEKLADRLHPNRQLARQLHLEDKGFFYSRFVVEEVPG